MDETLVEALRADFRTAPITDAERAMLAYAAQVTVDATAVSRDTLDGLRAHGFDDRAILQMTLIASWFNYINRVADALGVGRDEPGTTCALPVPPAASWVGAITTRDARPATAGTES